MQLLAFGLVRVQGLGLEEVAEIGELKKTDGGGSRSELVVVS